PGAPGDAPDEADSSAVAEHSLSDGGLIVKILSEAIGDLSLVHEHMVVFHRFHLMGAYRHENGEFPGCVALEQLAVSLLGVFSVDLELHATHRHGPVPVVNV